MDLPVLVVVVALAIGAVWWLSRASELFFVSVRDGKVLVVRGRVPVSLLQSFAEAVREPTVRRGSIRAWRAENGGQLACSGGIDEGREQRMRNAFMLYPASKLRQAPAVGRPTLGQVLGIAWLAWLLDRH
jgi:hypothetical protein